MDTLDWIRVKIFFLKERPILMQYNYDKMKCCNRLYISKDYVI